MISASSQSLSSMTISSLEGGGGDRRRCAPCSVSDSMSTSSYQPSSKRGSSVVNVHPWSPGACWLDSMDAWRAGAALSLADELFAISLRLRFSFLRKIVRTSFSARLRRLSSCIIRGHDTTVLQAGQTPLVGIRISESSIDLRNASDRHKR